MREGQRRNRARQLRHEMTFAERRLWSILQGRQLDGHRFRRQCPVGPYIADFACLEAGVIVEADGGQHMESARDAVRDRYLRRCGFRVLRFWNNDVMANLDGVREAIAVRLADSPPSRPSPAGGGRGRTRRAMT
jgi:very-short-patch-repair endonuclease